MSALQVLFAKLSKVDFHILSTHSQSHIYHKQSAVTFPVTKLNFLCCTVWEMFAFLFTALKYSSNDLPVSYILHYTKSSQKSYQWKQLRGVSGFVLQKYRRNLLLCLTSILAFKFRTANSHTNTYRGLWVHGRCQCEKKLQLHTSNGPACAVHLSAWALQYYVELVELIQHLNILPWCQQILRIQFTIFCWTSRSLELPQVVSGCREAYQSTYISENVPWYHFW